MDARYRKTIIAAAVLISLGASLSLRLALARSVTHPGHGDPSFYASLARNIASGRGMRIDYIWHFLSPEKNLSHTANDFWMPLTSYIISGAFKIFGENLFSALVPAFLAAMLLSLVAYAYARHFSEKIEVAAASACLVMFMPAYLKASLQTDSPIYYALFASSGILFMIKGWRRPGFLAAAAAFIGLAHLTRQDGMFLMLLLLALLSVSPQPWRAKLGWAAVCLAIYLLILSPLLWLNMRTFGRPLPPAPPRVVFLTEYEDLYSSAKDLSRSNYLSWGWGNIVKSKITAARFNLKVLYESLGLALTVSLVIGLVLARGRLRRREHWADFAPFVFLLGLYLFYSVVMSLMTVHGAFWRSSIAVLPFLTAPAVAAWRRFINSRLLFAGVAIVVGAALATSGFNLCRVMINRNTRLGKEMKTVGKIISRDAAQAGLPEAVVMTRDPWELNYSTGYKALQIPNESLPLILATADKYGATHIILPGRRKSLLPIYKGAARHERLRHVSRVPHSALKVFRIEPEKERRGAIGGPARQG